MTVVDAGIEELERNRFRHLIGVIAFPKCLTVNADRLLTGHGTHGAVVAVCLSSAFGNAPVGLAAGVFGMVDIAALVGEDALNELIEFGGHKKSLY